MFIFQYKQQDFQLNYQLAHWLSKTLKYLLRIKKLHNFL